MSGPETFVKSQNGEAQRLVAGYAKTGRTWMRYMLGHALSTEHALGVDVNLTNVYSLIPNDGAGLVPGQPTFQYEGLLPKIEMTHQPFSDTYKDSQTVFLTRDPRDVMVSHWLHHKNQLGKFNGSLGEFIRSPLGIGNFVTHLESWVPELDKSQVITYEAMREKPIAALRTINTLLDIGLSEQSIQQAVAAGEMDQMRKTEVKHGIAGHSYDRSNPEALRVRRGKVGGFIDYMDAANQIYVESALTELSGHATGIIAMTGYFDSEQLQHLE